MWGGKSVFPLILAFSSCQCGLPDNQYWFHSSWPDGSAFRWEYSVSLFRNENRNAGWCGESHWSASETGQRLFSDPEFAEITWVHLFFFCNFKKYKSERNALLQYRAKWAIINFIYLFIISFDLLLVYIPGRHWNGRIVLESGRNGVCRKEKICLQV